MTYARVVTSPGRTATPNYSNNDIVSAITETLVAFSPFVNLSDNSTSEEHVMEESSLSSNGDDEADSKPTAIKIEKKLTFSSFDSVNPNFDEWFISVQNELIKTNLDYLLSETVTNGINCDDSETVAMELSNKLTGDACKLFLSTPSHLYYVRGCRGIEMFHLLTSAKIQAVR